MISRAQQVRRFLICYGFMDFTMDKFLRESVRFVVHQLVADRAHEFGPACLPGFFKNLGRLVLGQLAPQDGFHGPVPRLDLQIAET